MNNPDHVVWIPETGSISLLKIKMVDDTSRRQKTDLVHIITNVGKNNEKENKKTHLVNGVMSFQPNAKTWKTCVVDNPIPRHKRLNPIIVFFISEPHVSYMINTSFEYSRLTPK